MTNLRESKNNGLTGVPRKLRVFIHEMNGLILALDGALINCQWGRAISHTYAFTSVQNDFVNYIGRIYKNNLAGYKPSCTLDVKEMDLESLKGQCNLCKQNLYTALNNIHESMSTTDYEFANMEDSVIKSIKKELNTMTKIGVTLRKLLDEIKVVDSQE